MWCHELEQILEQQDDGPLPQAAVAHIDTCEACRALTADLDAIRAAAVELSAEDAAPPERVWISLRNQLEAEGIIHEPTPAREGAKHGGWFFLQHPALAGAFLGLVLIVGGLLGYYGALNPGTSLVSRGEQGIVTQTDIKRDLINVASATQSDLESQDPVVTASLRHNLDIVDNLIAACEKSVDEQPENEMAREYLYGAYQQKAELLAMAVNRTTGGLQ